MRVFENALLEEESPGRLHRLEEQLDTAYRDGTVLLCKYKLLSAAHRRFGGQGVVQFAECVHDRSLTYAFKFFLSWETFRNETDLYANKDLQGILPPIVCICGNEDGAVEAMKWPLPPMLVLEKGECLEDRMARCEPDFFSSLQIVMHVLKRVNELHQAGYCHRDLKPANTVFLHSRNEWAVIDYASCARIGTAAPLSFSMAYAAPEVIQAARQGHGHVLADPAADVWSVGILAFELFSRRRMFQGFSHGEVLDMASGNTLYPWERVDTPLCAACLTRLGFMKDVILLMLQREPTRRVSLGDARDAWQRALGLDAAADGDDLESLMLSTMPSSSLSP